MSAVSGSPRWLYRRLLRQLSALPAEAQAHYKHRIRQEFNSHASESDPQRVEQITLRALADAEWIVKKYKGEDETT